MAATATTEPSALEQHHIDPILQSFPKVNHPVAYNTAVLACNALSGISFSANDKAQLKNSVDILANVYTTGIVDVQLLGAQNEVRNIFEVVIGVSRPGDAGQDRAKEEEGEESLLEKVFSRGGEDAARALLLGEAPTAAPPTLPATTAIPPSDVRAVKPASHLTLLPGPCPTQTQSRQLGYTCDYRNEQLFNNAQLRSKTFFEFREYTTGTDPYFLVVGAYHAARGTGVKVDKVQGVMDEIDRGLR